MLRCLILSLYAIIPVFLQAAKETQNNKDDFIDSSPNLTRSEQKSFNLPLDHPGVFNSMQFLWWQLNETSLDYAVHKTYPSTTLQASNALTLGHVHTVDIDWSPGFRLGLGYRFAKDAWQLEGVYTYYYTKGNDQVSCAQCHANNPTLNWLSMTVASNIDAILEGSSNLHFWYHIGDIELAKPVCLGKYTNFRLIVGPSMGFIQQKFHTLSVDNTNTFSPYCPAQYTKTKMDWSFSGGGIKIGIDSHWNVWDRFNFLFGAHLTALYGFYVNKWHAQRLITSTTGHDCTPFLEDFGDWTIKDRRNIFGTRIFGGIAYNYPFKQFNVELYINYELNTWFNLTDQYRMEGGPFTNSGQQPIDRVRSISTAPLNLSGVDFGLKLHF